jgi:GNAT superfamily N-acetyltransferase
VSSSDGEACTRRGPVRWSRRVEITSDYSRSHELSDGSRVTVRAIRPDDKQGLADAFARMSPTSRFRRFMSHTANLSDQTLRYLTEVDLQNHFAIVATTDSLDLKSEVGLGVARFIRLGSDPETAEAAVTVVDDAQRKGLGRILMQTLAQAAAERGVRTFRAEVLASNLPMRGLLEEAGAVVRESDGEALVFDVPLGEAPERAYDEPAHPLRNLLRAVAASVVALRGWGQMSDKG